jgi:hypothetical protein
LSVLDNVLDSWILNTTFCVFESWIIQNRLLNSVESFRLLTKSSILQSVLEILLYGWILLERMFWKVKLFKTSFDIGWECLWKLNYLKHFLEYVSECFAELSYSKHSEVFCGVFKIVDWIKHSIKCVRDCFRCLNYDRKCFESSN